MTIRFFFTAFSVLYFSGLSTTAIGQSTSKLQTEASSSSCFLLRKIIGNGRVLEEKVCAESAAAARTKGLKNGERLISIRLVGKPTTIEKRVKPNATVVRPTEPLIDEKVLRTNQLALSKTEGYLVMKFLHKNNISACSFSKELMAGLFGLDDVCIHVKISEISEEKVSVVWDRKFSTTYDIVDKPGWGTLLEGTPTRKRLRVFEEVKVSSSNDNIRVSFAYQILDGKIQNELAFDLRKSSPYYHPLIDILT